VIAAALAEQGVEVPEDVLPPDVWAIAVPYRVAFDVLSAARGQNMNGWSPLAYSEIVRYAHENGYATSIDDLEEFVAFLQTQDTAFLSESAQALARKTKAGS
jgi:hypothetical protein